MEMLEDEVRRPEKAAGDAGDKDEHEGRDQFRSRGNIHGVRLRAITLSVMA